MVTRRQWLIQSGSAALMLGAPSCGKQNEAREPKSKFIIGVSQSNLGEPYRVQMNADLEREAGAHPNLSLLFKDAQNDSLRQRAQVEELTQQGIDALIVSPKESAPLTAPVAAAYGAGIPVVVLDRRVEGDRFSAFIGPDNRRIGRAAGEWAVQALGGRGKIVELKGLMTSSPARERHEGFWEGVDRQKHPELVVAFEADTQWLEPNARREMESALAAHPKIDLVFAHNDPGAHGAYLAAKAVGREKEMKFIGIDALPHEGVRYVREGLIDVTFQYSTCAKQAITAVLALLQKQPVQKELILGTRRFDRASVDSGGVAI